MKRLYLKDMIPQNPEEEQWKAWCQFIRAWAWGCVVEDIVAEFFP